MSELKHTPGPWFVKSPNEPGDDFFVRKVDAYGSVCLLPADSSLYPNREANARLIAAAPELLESCESAINALTESDGGYAVGEGNIKDAVECLRAAIARATQPAADPQYTCKSCLKPGCTGDCEPI